MGGCVSITKSSVREDERTVEIKIENPMKTPRPYEEIELKDDTVEHSKTKGRARRAGIRGERNVPTKELVVITKSAESMQVIVGAMKNHYIFGKLGDSEIHAVADAMAPLGVQLGYEIMKQGDQGDFFYVIESGEFQIFADEKAVDVATAGQCVGELALLFGHPRTATVVAKTEGLLWKLGRQDFRAAMGKTSDQQTMTLMKVLKNVSILSDLREYQRMRIAEALMPITFKDHSVIQKAGEVGTKLFLITHGSVVLTADGTKLQGTEVHEDEADLAMRSVEANQKVLQVGDFFGERSLLLDEPVKHTATASGGDVECYTMDRASFDRLMGPLRDLLAHVQDLRLLESIPILQKLTEKERNAVIAAFETRTYSAGEYIIKQGEIGDSFYVVKSGTVVVSRNVAAVGGPAESFVIRRYAGQYFGEMSLIDDEPRSGNVIADGNVIIARLGREDFERLLGPLRLIMERDTTNLRKRIKEVPVTSTESFRMMELRDLNIHRTLGTGAFGRVKLVEARGKYFALKCLKKSEVVSQGQQDHVRNELEIMSIVNHPFVMKLSMTFKDQHYVYMMFELIQGGELFRRISSLDSALSSHDARFYTANVIEALEYVHSQDIIYRDLKPENILIDKDGYLKMVDFGCAKIVIGKTYTLCGSPEYVAPEVLLGRGYNYGADMWSLGVLVYEMAVGFSPFNPSQNLGHLQVCSNIIQGNFAFPRGFTDTVLKDFIRGLLMVDPTKRLGMLAGGWDDVRNHAWFNGFDWELMRQRKMQCPWVPEIKSANDSSMFDTIEEDDDPDLDTRYADDMPGWDANF